MHYVITGTPVTKKNSMRLLGLGRKCPVCGKPAKVRPAPSKAYNDYERQAVAQLKAQALPFTKPIDYPVTVAARYYMPTRHLCDLVNLLEATDDILTAAGILQDDNYSVIASHDGSRVMHDKNYPRVEIEVTPI